MGCFGKRKKKAKPQRAVINHEAQEAAEEEARIAMRRAEEARERAEKEWNDWKSICATPR